jgi:hypothetical protein
MRMFTSSATMYKRPCVNHGWGDYPVGVINRQGLYVFEVGRVYWLRCSVFESVDWRRGFGEAIAGAREVVAIGGPRGRERQRSVDRPRPRGRDGKAREPAECQRLQRTAQNLGFLHGGRVAFLHIHALPWMRCQDRDSLTCIGMPLTPN